MDLEGNKSRRLMRKAVNAKTARLAGMRRPRHAGNAAKWDRFDRLPTVAGASPHAPVCDLYFRLQSCGSIVELKSSWASDQSSRLHHIDRNLCAVWAGAAGPKRLFRFAVGTELLEKATRSLVFCSSFNPQGLSLAQRKYVMTLDPSRLPAHFVTPPPNPSCGSPACAISPRRPALS